MMLEYDEIQWRNHMKHQYKTLSSIIILIFSITSIYLYKTNLNLQEAIADVIPQLAITIVFLLPLGAAATYLAQHSQRLDRASESKENRPMVGLRARLRHRAARSHQGKSEDKGWQSSFFQSISTEMIGAIIATVFLGFVLTIFGRYEAIQNQQTDLVLQMGSPDYTTAIEAVRRLKANDWLDRGILDGEYFAGADLHGVSLAGLDMRGADFTGANLEGTNLSATFLEGAIFCGANLRNAKVGIDYHSVAAINTSRYLLALTETTEAEYIDPLTTWLKGSIMPDCTEWSIETDIGRFTNPSHPNFWDPCIYIEPLAYCHD